MLGKLISIQYKKESVAAGERRKEKEGEGESLCVVRKEIFQKKLEM